MLPLCLRVSLTVMTEILITNTDFFMMWAQLHKNFSST